MTRWTSAMTLRGTVGRLRRAQGCGFIVRPGGVEYFFDRRVLRGASFEELRPGQAVTFLEVIDIGPPRARRVFVE
jgi:cold shock CspA family protein